MKFEQVYNVVNETAKELIGEAIILNKDLSNIVDVGKEMFEKSDVDVITEKLVDKVGKVVFVSRAWAFNLQNIHRETWEYGAVMQKVHMLPVDAVKSDTWALKDGQTYDPNIFYAPKAVQKLFKDKTTFDVRVSFPYLQVKSAFNSAIEMNAFLAMIEQNANNEMNLRIFGLTQSTVNSFLARTLHNDFPAKDYTTKSGQKAVNLLKLYNDTFNPSPALTVDKCLTTPEFIRFAVGQMKLYIDKLASVSTLFNIGGTRKQTSGDRLNAILHSEFKTMADVYLQSDVFHNQYTALPAADTLAFWQGEGKSFSFTDTSSIDVSFKDDKDKKQTVKTSGILGCLFDREALGICNLDRRTHSNFNPAGEFYNNFYKVDVGFYNDLNENFVMFFVA
jgi:hypothetical protein